MIYTALGLVGVATAFIPYLFVQAGKMDGNGLWFSVCNAIACVLVLISLLGVFHLPTLVLEILFLGASILGIVKYIKRRR